MTRISNRALAALLTAVFALLCLWAYIQTRGRDSGSVAVIAVDGREERRIDLSLVFEEETFDIDTENGHNTVEIRHNAIRILSADCHDEVCVNRGWLTGGMVPIVCLPHRLVITLETGGDEAAPDAVAG